MKFQAKLRKIGNSQGIYIPLKFLTGFKIGDKIELEIITSVKEKKDVITEKETKPQKVITLKKHKYKGNPLYQFCPKHPGSLRITCGCKTS